MNLLKSKLRRTTAVLAGSILGLAGVAVLAAPASAHTPVVKGTASCLTGDSWSVDWAVASGSEFEAKVAAAAVVDQDGKDLPLTGALEVGAAVPVASNSDETKQVHGATAITDAAVTSAKISVSLSYAINGGEEVSPPVTVTVQKPTETCATPEPSSSTTSTASPSPSNSPGVPVPTPSGAAEPTPILEFYCDAMVIGLDNPADGVTWKLHFKTSKGEERDLTVKPGEKKTEVFSAAPGFSVRVDVSTTVDGQTYPASETIKWDQPKGCENGSGGGLPVTGAAAGGIAGGAAVLLAIGATLFVLARRRRVKFTA